MVWDWISARPSSRPMMETFGLKAKKVLEARSSWKYQWTSNRKNESGSSMLKKIFNPQFWMPFGDTGLKCRAGVLFLANKPEVCKRQARFKGTNFVRQAWELPLFRIIQKHSSIPNWSGSWGCQNSKIAVSGFWLIRTWSVPKGSDWQPTFHLQSYADLNCPLIAFKYNHIGKIILGVCTSRSLVNYWLGCMTAPWWCPLHLQWPSQQYDSASLGLFSPLWCTSLGLSLRILQLEQGPPQPTQGAALRYIK